MIENLHGCTAILLSPQEEVRSQADVAWDALHASLREFLPPCADRALFTADRLSDEQWAECASICATCPVASLCGAFAIAANVKAGFWAGRLYSVKNTAPGGSRQSTERQDHEQDHHAER